MNLCAKILIPPCVAERLIVQIQVKIGGTIHQIRSTTMDFFGGNTAKNLLKILIIKGNNNNRSTLIHSYLINCNYFCSDH